MFFAGSGSSLVSEAIRDKFYSTGDAEVVNLNSSNGRSDE